MSLFATHSELILSLAKLTSALLIAFAVDPFLKRSALRAAFWAGVLLILPTVILATHGRGIVNILPLPSAAERVETAPAVMPPAPAAPVVMPPPSAAPVAIPTTQPLAATPSQKTVSQKMPEVQKSPTNWVAVVFFTGLALSLLPTLLSLLRIAFAPKRPANNETLALWESIRPQGMQTVPLYVTSSPSAPFTAGLVRTAILLPESSAAWPLRRLRSTLHHEAAHIARRDILVRMAVSLVRAILWFHPLVWLAHRKLVAAQEEACDEIALSAGIPPDEYAEDLLETAKHSQFAFAHTLHMARWSQLGSRIQTILHYKQTTHHPINMKTIATAILGITVVTYGLSTVGFSQTPEAAQATAPAIPPAFLPVLNLPGIQINAEERFVDVAGTICLESGALELIACTKGTKEHESIVLVEARPSLIHAALLLVGAKNGNPAVSRAVGKEMTGWMDIPAKGDPIYVSLVWEKKDGTTVERPISDFLKRSEFANQPAEEKGKNEKFPEAFLFAGSHLGDPAETPRKYLAELSGSVISIATFGDELLCLPDFHGKDNNALDWQIDSTHLPKLNSKVTLRLRTVKSKGNSEEAKAAVSASGKIGNADGVHSEKAAAPADPATKLRTIIIPSIEFKNVSLVEAFKQLRLLTKELDIKEPDEEKKGVKFLINYQHDTSVQRMRNMRFENVSCQIVLNYMCNAMNLRYTVNEFAIVISPQPEAGADPVPDAEENAAAKLEEPRITVGTITIELTETENAAAKLEGNSEEAKAAVPANGKIENADAVRQGIVTVAGFVRAPGLQPFTPGLTIYQAVAVAGGATEFGLITKVLLKRDKTIRVYDLNVLENRNIVLQPDDTIEVVEKR